MVAMTWPLLLPCRHAQKCVGCCRHLVGCHRQMQAVDVARPAPDRACSRCGWCHTWGTVGAAAAVAHQARQSALEVEVKLVNVSCEVEQVGRHINLAQADSLHTAQKLLHTTHYGSKAA